MELKMAKAIGSTMWRTVKPLVCFYAAQVPGDGGKDWGYTEKQEQALPLTPYWQRRFARDMERCGRSASFSEKDDSL